MNRAEAIARLVGSRVGYLATTKSNGDPHVIPVTFAVLADSVVTAIDHKPKSTRRLQRLVNIEDHPSVALIADHYDEDWARLWWVRVDGEASIVATHSQARETLTRKYEQYKGRPPEGPFIVIEMTRVSWWASIP